MSEWRPRTDVLRPSALTPPWARLASFAALCALAACGNGTPSSAGAASAASSSSPTSSVTATTTSEGSAAPSAASSPSATTATTDAPAGAAVAAPSASGTADAAAAQGAKRDADAYGAWLEAPKQVKAGSSTAVQAVLVAKEGYKCNDKYPFKFKLDPAPAGLSYPEPIAKSVTYGPKRTTLAIPVAAEKAGSYTVSGTFSLSVCNDTACKMQRESLSVPLEVQ